MSRDELKRINDAIRNAEYGIDKFGKHTDNGQYFVEQLNRLREEKSQLPVETLQEEQIAHLKAFVQSEHRSNSPLSMQHYIDKHGAKLRDLGLSDDAIQAHIDNAIAEIMDELKASAQEKLLKSIQNYSKEQVATGNNNPDLALAHLITHQESLPTYLQRDLQRVQALEIDISELQSTFDAALSVSPEEKNRTLKKLTDLVKRYMSDLSFKAELDPSYTLPDDMIAAIASWQADDAPSASDTQRKIIRAQRDALALGIAENEVDEAINTGYKQGK